MTHLDRIALLARDICLDAAWEAYLADIPMTWL